LLQQVAPSRLSLSTTVLPALSTNATPLPSHRRCQSSTAKTEVPNDEDINNDRQGMVVAMVDVVLIAARAVAVAVPPLPTTATTLTSCCRHCCYSTAKTKARWMMTTSITRGKGLLLLSSLLSLQQVLPPLPSLSPSPLLSPLPLPSLLLSSSSSSS
jgi:hypothetical protein